MMEGVGRKSLSVAAVLVAAAALASSGQAGGRNGWRTDPPLPVPRSEVASAVAGTRVVVIGGFLEDGSSSRRVDAYDSAARRWRRLPDLPVAVNHAMAASDGRRVYVVGGYVDGRPARVAFVLDGSRWQRLPIPPGPRAAGGAAVAGGKLYVVGGVVARGRLARNAFVFDLRRGRWSAIAGPTPREHLGVAALGGRIFAVGGRTSGFDTNLGLAEELIPATRRWRELPALPDRRGGTGLASGGGLLVSVGGEAPGGTIARVYAYAPGESRWRRLADVTTPRHGLVVAAVGGRVYAIGGGPEPGLSVSAANESLGLP